MGRIDHSTKSVIAAMFLVSLCALFCLLAGCEEGMVEARQPAAGPDLIETVKADIETIAKADPAAGILAEMIDPEPETVLEEQALAEPVEEIGLTDPIPTKSLDITQDETDSAMNLDKMHIADAPLLGDNANPLEEHQEIQVQEQQVAPEAADSKGFIATYFVTPGSVVLKFTGRYYIILLSAILCVVAWRAARKKNSADPQRTTNSHA